MTLVTVYSKPDCHLCVDAMAALRRLQAELGFALVIATHDVDVAARAQRVVCLAEGRVTTEERQR